MKYTYIIIRKQKIKTRTTNTNFELVKGLMFKRRGRLLLDFGKECKPGIWMLFMKFPLDLIFLDSSGKIVDIIENVKPFSLNPKTWKIYYPRKNCRYCLEVEAGFVKKFKIEVGKKILEL